LIALSAYLDSSGKLEDQWITLAAVAAREDIWTEFETAWQHIFDSHMPKASYIHMKEVFRLEKAFAANLGWNHDSAFGVVIGAYRISPLVPKTVCECSIAQWI
jgi:hypothetical protein